MMKLRRLCRNGPELSAVGLGCMGMSAFYGGRDGDESVRTLHRAAELGVTFFDTADAYANGLNEELVGRELREVRDRVFIATKFANTWAPTGERTGISGKPDYVRSACNASLKRLGVDVIDLLYQHRVDPGTPIEDTVGAMAGLVQAGKVRHLGLSEAGPETIRRAHAVHPIAALQTEWSLWEREPETKVLPVLRELGIGFVPYSPLGRGFLTGQIRSEADLPEGDFRRNAPRFQGENLTRNLQLVDRVQQIATEKGCTPAQLALAWLLAQGPDVVPIPGTKQRSRLQDNVGAVEVTLSGDDLRRLDELAPAGVAAGDRYASMASIDS